MQTWNRGTCDTMKRTMYRLKLYGKFLYTQMHTVSTKLKTVAVFG